jgi:hypothetical protein
VSPELLGEAILELDVDLGPLDRGLLTAERRVALATATMQQMLDRDTARMGTSFGRIGQDYDRSLSEPIARFGTATARMAKEVDGSVAQMRIEQAALSRDMEHSAAVSQAAGRTQTGAVREVARAYGEEAAAAKAAKDAVVLSDAEKSRADAAYIRSLERHAAEARALDAGALSGMGGRGGGGLPPTAVAPAGGGGGEDSNLFADVALGRMLVGHRGGGHGRPPGWAGYLLGPAIGAGAAVGSLAGFAGLGNEHILTTLLGLGGSAAGAGIGAGFLGLGMAGQQAVGGGADAAVMHSTIAQTKELDTAYEKVAQAVAKYGAGSKQAVMAQHELNMLMAELGNTAGVKAELGLAKQEHALHEFWNTQTSQARVNATEILSQVLRLGHDYVPRVAAAAQMNLAIINRDIRPMFSWLEGPKGVGIFNDLEKRFREQLPTAIHAGTQGFELFLRVIDQASHFTGGFVKTLDHFFTRLNGLEDAQIGAFIGKMIGMFQMWSALVKVLGQDVYYLFKQSSGTASSIVEGLTHALEKLREWEKSTRGSAQLRTIFEVHKEQLEALGHALLPMITAFGHVYLAVAPGLTKLTILALQAFTPIVDAISSMAAHSQVFALMLGGILISLRAFGAQAVWGGIRGVARSLGEASGLATADAAAQNELAAAQARVAATADVAAPAVGRLGAVELAGGGGMMLPGGTNLSAAERANATTNAERAAAGAGGGLFGGVSAAAKGLGPKLLKGGAYGIAGALGAEVLTSALPVGHEVKGVLQGAITGAATGAAFGPWGAAAGAAVGVGLEAAMGLFAKKAPDYGKNFAKGFTSQFGAGLTPYVDKHLEAELHKIGGGVTRARQQFDEVQRRQAQEREPGFLNPQSPTQQASEFNRAFQNRFKLELREGLAAAEQMKAGLETISHKTVGAFTMDTALGLRRLSGEARLSAGRAMVAYAAELEQKGQLPKGAVHKVLTSLQSQFPGFADYMREHALGTSRQVAAAMRLQGAERNLTESLNNLRAEWGLFNLDRNVNGKNMVHNLGLAMRDLKALLKQDPGNKELQHKLSELEHHSDSVFKNMLHSTDTNMKKWGELLRGGLSIAGPAAEQELAKFTAAVHDAVEAGALTMAEGAELITTATNAELKALGGAKIAQPKIQAHLAQSGHAPHGSVGASSQNRSFGPGVARYGGGMVQFGQPGDRGHDSIYLNMGGTDIAVGPGEVGAVLTRHQQAYLNERLAPEGGLHGFFDHVNTPHFMAEGGLVGKMVGKASEITGHHYPYVWGGGHGNFNGPYDCSGAVSAVLHSAGLLGRPETSGELMSFGQPGPGDVTVYANPEHTFMSIMGRFFGTHGSSGAGWYAGGARPGFAVRHAPLKPGEAAFGQISPPGVKGTGPQADALRHGMIKMAHAANAYVEKHGLPTGVPGSSEAHGAVKRPQLEALWIAAGGPRNMAHTMAAVAMAESGGNPQSVGVATSGGRARGLWQIMLPANNAYMHGSPEDPLANARAAVAIFHAQGIRAWEAYTNGSYRRFMGLGGAIRGFQRGGVVPGFAAGGPISHKEHGAPQRITHVKGTRHVPHTRTPRKPGLKPLITDLAKIPGMGEISHELAPAEDTINVLGDEFGLLGQMASNPASLLAADMPYLMPTLQPGEHFNVGELVTHAERQMQRAGAGGDNQALQLQSSLLGQIAGLDDHRLLSAPDIGVLAKDFKTNRQQMPFPVGYPVFKAQQSVLEAERRWQEVLVRLLRRQKDKAVEFIKRRIARRAAMMRLLRAAHQRYARIKKQLEEVHRHGLQRKLGRAVAAQHVREQREDAQVHHQALSEAISAEKQLPPWERNEALIQSWKAEQGRISGFLSRLHGPSDAISAAREALMRDDLKKELHPIEDEMSFLGGSPTKVATGGQIGALTSQITGLQSGATTIDGKIKEAVGSTIPQLTLSIEGIVQALQDSAEAVRPVAQPAEAEAATAAEKPGDAELLALTKQQLEKRSLELAVSQAQYKVLGQLPRFGGHFAEGGIVPGYLGEPRMVVAHGGEEILKAGGNRYSAHVHVADGMGWLKDLISVEVRRHERGQAVAASRPLPSRGGGLHA